MIDHTNSRINEQDLALRRKQLRRYAFSRMLGASDRVLGCLEEMNRDGVISVPKRERAEIREVVAGMPSHVREAFRDNGLVQDTLDSLFEVQERLLRWRYPDWTDFDPDGDELDLVG